MVKVTRNFKRAMRQRIFFKIVSHEKSYNHKDMLLAVVWDVNISFCEFEYLVSWLMDPISDISAVFTSPERSLEA